MDIKKLKIDNFSHIKPLNFPPGIKLPFAPPKSPIEVILYYIDKIEDVTEFVKTCQKEELIKDNRTIMVYKKGRKDGVNRDTIFAPFKEGTYPGFSLKAPMLCSLDEQLSACVMQYKA